MLRAAVVIGLSLLPLLQAGRQDSARAAAATPAEMQAMPLIPSAPRRPIRFDLEPERVRQPEPAKSSPVKTPPVGSSRLVCGMTVTQVGPREDPKFVVRSNDTVEYSVRRVPPPVCAE